MEGFWKASAILLIAVILGLSLGKQEMSVLLTMAASCMVSAVAFVYLEPVLDLVRELENLGQLPEEMLRCLLQAVGIAMVSEIVGKICTDAGNSTLGKSMQLLGNAAILYVSIPAVRSLIHLIREILGEI